MLPERPEDQDRFEWAFQIVVMVVFAPIIVMIMSVAAIYILFALLFAILN